MPADFSVHKAKASPASPQIGDCARLRRPCRARQSHKPRQPESDPQIMCFRHVIFRAGGIGFVCFTASALESSFISALPNNPSTTRNGRATRRVPESRSYSLTTPKYRFAINQRRRMSINLSASTATSRTSSIGD